MLVIMIELAIIALWMTIIATHGRRLFRLTQVEPVLTQPHERQLRRRLDRVWWWLGRQEFWRAVESDSVRCVQVTLMLFVMALGM